MRTTFAVLGLLGAVTLSACAGSDAPTPGESPTAEDTRTVEEGPSPDASPTPDDASSPEASPTAAPASALEEALALEMRPEGTLAMVFTDVRGIVDTVGKEPVAFADAPARGEWDEADRWALGVVGHVLPPAPDGFSPLVPSNDVDWIFDGVALRAIHAPNGQVEATRAIVEEAHASERFEFEDGYILQPRAEGHWRPDVEDSFLGSPVVQSLLPCLEGAHLAALISGDGDLPVDHSFATAARVDEDLQGHAWACVHVPDDAQAYAESLDSDRLGEVRVEGDVGRVEVLFEEDNGGLPPAAGYGHVAAMTMSPGF